MTKIIKVLIVFFIISGAGNANEKMNKIVIDGNQRISDETIKIYGEIDLKKNINENEINKILKNLYSTNFFENVDVSFSNNILKISLKEYPVINQLILIGEKSNGIKKQIKKIISLKEKRSFIKSKLSDDLETIKNLYSSIGYNFPKVEAKVKDLDGNNLDLIIEIDKGKESKITSIKFIGDKKIKDKRLKDIIASEEYKFWKFISRNTKFNKNLVNLDLRLLQNYYKSLGYYDISINSNSAEILESGDVNLIYSIEAGTRYVIQKISTNLDPTFDNKIFLELNKEYNKYIGEYYSPFKIQKLLESIDELIEKNNLQFVEHNVEEILDGENIAIKFNIFEGEKVLVERINVIGNNVTNESVIRGELLLDEGDPYTQIKLDKSVAKIRSRNIFRNVRSKVSNGTENNLKVIDINIEEKPTGEISAGAGVGTNGGSFGISISENNWLGKGKKIKFELEVDEESLAGDIQYLDPNYNFLGNQISYNLFSKNNDKPDQGFENTLVGFGINTKFEQYKNIFTSLGLSASYDDLQTLSSASSSLKKQSGEFTELSGIYGFSYDTRDRAFMPTNGAITSFKQSLPFFADKRSISNTLSSSIYRTISEDIIGASKFYFSAINGLDDEDVRISKRTFLSTKRLRGFKKGMIGPIDGKDHVGGNFASALNFEANLPNILPEDTNMDVGVFLDFGNVWGVDYDSSIDDSNEIRSSTGVALNWSSPIGPMTFILSQNLSKANTDETESFNFNLGTTF
jgi:outer membrane protein insertion porin family